MEFLRKKQENEEIADFFRPNLVLLNGNLLNVQEKNVFVKSLRKMKKLGDFT